MPQTIPLWPKGAVPHSQGDAPEDLPALTIHRPRRPATGLCVVCPGGGYHVHAPHEAEPVAKWLTSIGLVGAILRYRLGPKYRHPAPLSDALQAVKLCRERAAEWGVEGKKIGILGFSAGGHLASSAAIHFTDSADRPDYGILIYPVITLEGPHAHGGSRTNLLGEKPDPALVKKLSNQTQVRPETPPLFLVHGTDDTVVPVENALLLASALSEKKVPFGMKIVAHGPHGFGMGNPAQPETITWPAECVAWLRAQKMG